MAFANLKEIGLELTEKSTKIMRSWFSIFNLTASIGPYYTSTRFQYFFKPIKVLKLFLKCRG